MVKRFYYASALRSGRASHVRGPRAPLVAASGPESGLAVGRPRRHPALMPASGVCLEIDAVMDIVSRQPVFAGFRQAEITQQVVDGRGFARNGRQFTGRDELSGALDVPTAAGDQINRKVLLR